MKKTKNSILRVGLTGGIASGKSTVAKLFELLSVPVYYSDHRAITLIENDVTLRKNIISLFGEQAYTKTGNYNRSYISSQVFQDKEKLSQLNQIVHPAVFQDQEVWFESLQAPFALVESALLIEANAQENYDYLIVVAADDSIRLDRIMTRDHLSKEKAQARMQSQLPQEIKIKQADFVIENNGNRSLIQQVTKIIVQLSKSK